LEEKQYFDKLAYRVIQNIDYSDHDKIYLLERIILSIITQIDHDKLLDFSNILDKLIEETNNFQHKPIVFATEAKYYILVEKNIDKARKAYDKAIQFAEILNDEILVNNLKLEKKMDCIT
ncbi:MAG TPA: hypothetical protein K8V99_08250, partial [Megamonas funiformis]|nr:hypothetical protein [Megamonas funiformis]